MPPPIGFPHKNWKAKKYFTLTAITFDSPVSEFSTRTSKFYALIASEHKCHINKKKLYLKWLLLFNKHNQFMSLCKIIQIKTNSMLKLKLGLNKKIFSYDILKNNLQVDFLKRQSILTKIIFRTLSNTPNRKRFSKNSF